MLRRGAPLALSPETWYPSALVARGVKVIHIMSKSEHPGTFFDAVGGCFREKSHVSCAGYRSG